MRQQMDRGIEARVDAPWEKLGFELDIGANCIEIGRREAGNAGETEQIGEYWEANRSLAGFKHNSSLF